MLLHSNIHKLMASVTTDLFADIDRMDAHAFASHLSEDCRLRFGNAEPVAGRSAIEAAITGFFAMIKGLSHDIVNQWDVGDTTVIESEVTYTRLDERQVTVPVVTIYRRGEELIDDYRIHRSRTRPYIEEHWSLSVRGSESFSHARARSPALATLNYPPTQGTHQRDV